MLNERLGHQYTKEMIQNWQHWLWNMEEDWSDQMQILIFDLSQQQKQIHTFKVPFT